LIAFKQGKLHRNFMGYSVKPADEFIGVGVSAIGFLENTHVQNVKILPDYYDILHRNELPVERGQILSQDDIIRRFVIQSLMCSFRLDKREFAGQMGVSFDKYFTLEADHLQQCEEDGLITRTGDTIMVTELGKIFIRNVCMGFDAYLRKKAGHKRFSRTV
jgi:oxygen-independent coproporphyrinogen III oxidase